MKMHAFSHIRACLRTARVVDEGLTTKHSNSCLRNVLNSTQLTTPSTLRKYDQSDCRVHDHILLMDVSREGIGGVVDCVLVCVQTLEMIDQWFPTRALVCLNVGLCEK